MTGKEIINLSSFWLSCTKGYVDMNFQELGMKKSLSGPEAPVHLYVYTAGLQSLLQEGTICMDQLFRGARGGELIVKSIGLELSSFTQDCAIYLHVSIPPP